MNKRIIRVIIYEGDEELVNAYEKHSLDRTQKSGGMPKYWGEPEVERGKEIYITGVTLAEEVGLFQAIEKHNKEIAHQFQNTKEITLKIPSMVEPILNQLNK